MQEPMLPLTDDELALVTSASTTQGISDLVEQIKYWLSGGHRSLKS